MKKIWNFALTALLVGGLSLAATSCKDDDNDSENGNGTEQPTAEEIAIEHAETFWSVAANLVSPFDVTDDYENKTFEPTIGVAQEGSSTVRVVNCGSMAAAASRFTSITGVEIDENTTTSTYQDDAVGTLTYTKTNDGTSLAKIDVSIKQIPHLQQIVFKTSEQMGTNGTFEGTAYYSFGDVISLDDDDGMLKEYWVCVRPALGPAGKEKSHWVTVNQLPERNLWTYQGKKKDITFILPTNLSKHYEHMQNLAELLYAVCNPEQWWENLQQNSGLDLFHDLKHERAKYFNQYFWQVVQKHWADTSDGLSLCSKLFGYDFEQMKSIVNDQNALHLLYYGFNWNTTWSDSPTLYEYTYSNGAGNRSNMHEKKYRAVSKNVMTGDGIELNCVKDYTNHWICPDFFGDEQPRFIFRFATGDELFGSEPNVFQSMQGGKHHIEDVYVLNQKLGIATQSDLKEFTEADVNGSNVVKNKTADDKTGVYVPGDVVKDERNHLWICIAGSGYNERGNPPVLDDRAWFISFGGITTKNLIPNNILTEAQAPEVGIRLLKFMFNISTTQGFLGRNNLGPVAQHVLDYAKVNAADLFIRRDSVWRFKNNNTMKYYDSSSQSYFNNLAYIGDDGQLKVLRCIFDLTMAGTERNECYPASGNHKDFDNQEFHMYKHYQNGDPNSWRALTDDERSLEMTRYLTPWPVTNDWMLFSDLGDQAKVDQYAAKDKWVTLPLTNMADPSILSTKREQPRTRVLDNLRASRFFMGDNGAFYDHLGMYNEPLLFVRVMTVKDKGGNRATLESEDGHKLTVVHLQDNAALYRGMFNWSEAFNYSTFIQFIDLDNEHYTMDLKFGD